MLKELLAANIDLYVDQGDTYYKEFTIKDNAGTAIDLTGKSLGIDIRRYANTNKTYPMSVNVVNAPSGIISLALTPAQSNSYIHDRYVYQVRISDGTDVIKIMTGQVLVEAGASSLNTELGIGGNTGAGGAGSTL